MTKVVLITGCSEGGLGYGFAVEFARHDCIVYATARKPERMKGLDDLGCKLLQLDVTDDKSVDRVVTQIKDEQGRIDMLINNAGAASRAPLLDMPMSKFESQFAVNVFGCVRMQQAVGKLMVQQRHGTIVNIGSMSALWSLPFLGAYSASKAALAALSDALRLELRPFNVHVMHVTLGFVKTKIFIKGETAGNILVDEQGPYADIKDDVKRDIFESVGFWPLTVEPVARRVARAALSSNPPSHYYDGRWVWNTWLTSKLAPTWGSDMFAYLATGLWKLPSAQRGTEYTGRKEAAGGDKAPEGVIASPAGGAQQLTQAK